jgi:FAD/FMN-containing dehydrogenase
MTTKIATLDGGTTDIGEEDFTAFSSCLRGTLLTNDSAGYDEARTVWNAMIDKRPALIARCAGAADVAQSVKFAAKHKLRIAIRGAGHNIAGKQICNDGLLIDLSQMQAVHVDPNAKVARVEPGATLFDLDHETQAFGLATPVGINSTTGIAGLTLGGGFGWLSRKHGLTIDNLRSADVVTADGRLLRASATENQDLFWGVRGGGGNLGIVTSFEFDLHPVGPQVLSGLVVHPYKAGKGVLEHYRKFTADAPDEVTVWTVLRKAPPLPFLPAEVHGTEVVILAAFYSGNMEDGEKALKGLREYGEPIADVISPHPYAGWNQAFDGLLTPGARNYWKSHNFAELSDGLLDIVLDYAGRLPSDASEIFFAQLGGATSRVAADATAYPHRDAAFAMNVHTRWTDKAEDEACVKWARAFADATAPHATGGVYVNFIPEDEDRVEAAYGSNFDRLGELKKKFDPNNMFRLNQNVKP